MPFYDYQCQDCKHVQEIYHSMTGPGHLLRCDKCNSKKMERYWDPKSAPYSKFVGKDWMTNKDRGIE